MKAVMKRARTKQERVTPLLDNIPWASIDAVTLDVFDTAVLRCTPEPRHVFLLVEARLAETNGSRFQGYAAVRFEAELETVRNAWRIDRSVSPGLSEIYDALARLRPDWADDAPHLMALECRTEMEVARGNPPMLALYREALALGKTVVFISDTHFPQDHMDALLSACGYSGPHVVFCSCEEQDNKAAGGLFRRVAEKMRLEPGKTLHVGDDAHSDGVQARHNGYRSRVIPKGMDLMAGISAGAADAAHPPTASDISDLLLRGLQQNDAVARALSSGPGSERSRQLGQLGYGVLGPILTGFTQWLTDSIGDRARRAYFVSRDGWLMKRAFDTYALHRPIPFESHYLYASRRNLLLATFRGEPGQVAAISEKLFSDSFKGHLKGFLEDLRLRPLSEREIERHGLRGLYHKSVFTMNAAELDALRVAADALFDSRLDELKSRAATEREAYSAYLGETGLLDESTVALVDCGWFGSTQAGLWTLLDMLGMQRRIHGYYLGTAQGANDRQPQESRMHGYLVHEGYSITRSRDFVEFARLIELFLKTDQAQFLFSQRDGQGPATPVFGAGSPVDPDLQYLQEEALRFMRDWLALGLPDHVRMRPSTLRAAVMQVLERPTMAQATALGSTPYSTDMLSDETVSRFSAPSIGTLDMIFNPARRRKDLSNSGSRNIYRLMTPSALGRLAVRMTAVDEMPATPVHAFLRRVKRGSVRRLRRLARP